MDQQVSPGTPSEKQAPTKPTAMGARRRRWLWLFALLIILVLLLGVIHHHRKKRAAVATAAAAAGMPIAVTSATAKTGEIGVYLNAIGTVTPVDTDSITPQVTGVIKAVHYREGQVVRKGEPLIDIDPRPYAAQLAEARGSLERDENLLAQAQMDLERYQQAWKRNAISRQQFEDQEKIVLQDEGTVNYDKGAVQYAQVQLDYCHIAAPISGRVGLRLVDPGNLVSANAGTTLVVITTIHPITVIFTLAEDSLPQVLGQLSQGRPLSVEVYDRTGKRLLGVGKLTSVDNQIDTTTGTVKLRATFDNSNNQLFPNQFVNTRLLVTTLHNQTLIPSSAIQHNGETAFVYVLEDGKAVSRVIKTGISDRGQTAVEGVRAGEVVATSSFEKLQNGTPVTISHATTPATSSVNDGVNQ